MPDYLKAMAEGLRKAPRNGEDGETFVALDSKVVDRMADVLNEVAELLSDAGKS